MKKSMSAQEIIEKRIENDLLIEALSVRDYKKNNRIVDKNFKLFKLLKIDLELAKLVYKELLSYDCVITRLTAAGECLSLGIYIEEALRILTEMSNRGDIGIRSFEAELTLKVWRGEVPGKTL